MKTAYLLKTLCRHHADSEDAEASTERSTLNSPHSTQPALPLAKEADAVMTPAFSKYITAHGYHFTDTLADYASRQLKNANGSNHRWSIPQVANAIKEDYSPHTRGDATYLANMLYSDYYPEVLASDQDVLNAARAMLHDPDGYDGMIFMRYVADLIGRHTAVDWTAYT